MYYVFHLGSDCNGADSWCCSPSHPCGHNDGDCDDDDECLPFYICGDNNCRDLNPGMDDLFDDTDDCCYPSKIEKLSADSHCIAVQNFETTRYLDIKTGFLSY